MVTLLLLLNYNLTSPLNCKKIQERGLRGYPESWYVLWGQKGWKKETLWRGIEPRSPALSRDDRREYLPLYYQRYYIEGRVHIHSILGGLSAMAILTLN